MNHLALTEEIARIRATGQAPDTSQGMAIIFWCGEAIGCYTVAFAREWCAGDPEYSWRKL